MMPVKEDLYEEIHKAYEETLRKNRDTFRGEYGVEASMQKLVQDGARTGSMVKSLSFQRRDAYSLYQDLSKLRADNKDMRKAFIKEKLSVFDIFIIVSDQYSGRPDDLFFEVYDKLYQGFYRMTVTGCFCDGEESFYVLTDKYRHTYRLYVQSELEYRRHLNRRAVGRRHGESDAPVCPGITVLDFAFAQGEEIGLHLERAYVNDGISPAGLDTVLKAGDHVRLEYDLSGPVTAVFEWFGYVKTDLAKEKLIGYFNRRFRG